MRASVCDPPIPLAVEREADGASTGERQRSSWLSDAALAGEVPTARLGASSSFRQSPPPASSTMISAALHATNCTSGVSDISLPPELRARVFQGRSDMFPNVSVLEQHGEHRS